MKVLIACEFSGIVRDAFTARGHEAWSCDYRPTERPGKHYQGSVFDQFIVKQSWDLMIAHPDCTFLAGSGARWMRIEWREEAQLMALHFVKALWRFPVEKLAIENPIGRLSSLWRGPDQTIQPYEFGHGETKATCLWLKNLPLLKPTNVVDGRNGRVWKESPGPQRARNRSRTYEGIAEAFAEQWGANGESPLLRSAEGEIEMDRKDDPYRDKKLLHKADKIDDRGRVSALCYLVPRPIPNRRGISWTMQDEAVNCENCLAKMREVQRKQGNE